MKKLYTLLTFLTIASLATAQLFESDFSNWTDDAPDGWVGSRTNLADEAINQVDNDGGTGDFAVQLIRTESGHQRFSTQPLTVEAGVNYEITFRVRGSGEVRTGLYDNREDAFGYVYANYNNINSEEWTEITQSLIAAENTDQAEFILSVRNTTPDAHIQVDYVVISGEELETVSIYDIQFTESPDGVSPLEGESVFTGGIVSAVIPDGQNNGFFIQDGSGPWQGVFVFTNQTVQRGDSVVFSANVVEFFNMTQLSGVAALTIVSSDNPVYAPVEINTADVNTEPYEGVLVRVTNATCTNANSGFGQWVVNDGSGSCLINPGIYEADREQGTAYNVTGPVFYSFDEFKILPRDVNDVEMFVSVNEQFTANGLSAWPNPARDVLNLTAADGTPLNGFLRVFDASGREWMQAQLGSQNGVINLGGLPAGYYLATFTSNEGQVNTLRFIKE